MVEAKMGMRMSSEFDYDAIGSEQIAKDWDLLAVYD
jgi:hypothetical protein